MVDETWSTVLDKLAWISSATRIILVEGEIDENKLVHAFN